MILVGILVGMENFVGWRLGLQNCEYYCYHWKWLFMDSLFQLPISFFAEDVCFVLLWNLRIRPTHQQSAFVAFVQTES
jgi:hypothetical protein